MLVIDDTSFLDITDVYPPLYIISDASSIDTTLETTMDTSDEILDTSSEESSGMSDTTWRDVSSEISIDSADDSIFLNTTEVLEADMDTSGEPEQDESMISYDYSVDSKLSDPLYLGSSSPEEMLSFSRSGGTGLGNRGLATSTPEPTLLDQENLSTVEPDYLCDMNIDYEENAVYFDESNPMDYFSEDTKEATDNLQQEPHVDYCRGGYMDIHIKQDINDFKIVRKLGFGEFSTIWLGKKNNCENQYNALKVGKASQYGSNVLDHEIKVLQMTKEKDDKHPGYAFVVKMLHNFEVASGHGLHKILVLEEIGYSIFDLMQEAAGNGITVFAAQIIIKQILLGLSYLHDSCGIFHGQINPANILIKRDSRNIEEMVKRIYNYEELNMCLPRKYMSSIEYRERAGIAATSWYCNPVDVSRRPATKCMDTNPNVHFPIWECPTPLFVSSQLQVAICDFGGANDHPHSGIEPDAQSLIYRSLEMYIQNTYGFPSDVWAAACIAFELVAGETLFPTKEVNQGEQEHVRLIYQLFGGKIPHDILANAKYSLHFFNENDKLRFYEDFELLIESPSDILSKYMFWPECKALEFESFILSCMDLDPKKRLTAIQASNHMWLNDI